MSRAERRRMERETKGGGGVPPGPVEEVVRAERFELVDKTGQLRGGMITSEDGTASIALSDRNGRPMIIAGVEKDGRNATFSISDDSGRERIVLKMSEDGIPLAILRGNDGKNRLRVSLSGTGSPQILLGDKEEKERLILVVDEEDKPALILLDKDGKTRGGLTLPSA